jgi:uncharacterized membrane protein YdjX (TVP38/TMEM64 family)
MAQEHGDALASGKGKNDGGPLGRLSREVIQHQRLISISIVVGVIILMALLWAFRDRLSELSQLGYAGVFIVTLVGSASLVIPVPGLAAVFAGGVVWDPLIVGVVAGVAMTLGEVTGYALGYAGQDLVQRHNRFRFLERWMLKAGGPIIFLGSLIPNPFFDILGVIAGSQRYPLRMFLLWALPGKVIKGIVVAYLGLYGMHQVLRWFGMG